MTEILSDIWGNNAVSEKTREISCQTENKTSLNIWIIEKENPEWICLSYFKMLKIWAKKQQI